MDEREATLVVALAEGVGPAGAERVRRSFGSYRAAVDAGVAGETRVDDVNARILESVAAAAATGEAERQKERAGEAGARIVLRGDREYPRPLAEIARPPLALFVRGRDLAEAQPAVAVVGTRRASAEGLSAARGLAADLAAAGLAIVSGLARGIDTAAHRGALDVGGTTVAVLGSGLDEVYPPENAGLADAIAAGGTVVTEFPMGSEAKPGHFPSRNRIIAGLSAGVVVVEAGRRSGALITAARALESGREVFAVPGPIGREGSRGPNGLLKAGAALVETAADVLDELWAAWGPFDAAGEPAPESSGGAGDGDPAVGGDRRPASGPTLRGRVVAALAGTPEGADTIARRLSLPVSKVLAALTELEMSGEARAWPGGRYSLSTRRADGGNRSC